MHAGRFEPHERAQMRVSVVDLALHAQATALKRCVSPAARAQLVLRLPMPFAFAFAFAFAIRLGADDLAAVGDCRDCS